MILPETQSSPTKQESTAGADGASCGGGGIS